MIGLLENAKERLAEYGDKVVTIKTNFRDLESVLKDVPFVPQTDGIPQVDGVLFDLGVSSPQFDEGNEALVTIMMLRWTCAWISQHF